MEFFQKMEGLSRWQTALTVNVMQALLQALGPALDGRILCRMRATCRLWRALLERVPEALRQLDKQHLIHIDCLCDLDDTLLAGFLGHAHRLVRIQPNAAWHLIGHSFFYEANVRVHWVWPKFKTAVAWLQHMGVVGAPANRAAMQMLTLVEPKTGDVFILVKSGMATVSEEALTALTRTTAGVVRWRHITIGERTHWEFGLSCDFAGLCLNTWFESVRSLWALHIPMRHVGIYSSVMFSNGIRIPNYAVLGFGISDRWTEGEERLVRECAARDIGVKRAPGGSRAKSTVKRKKRKVRDDDEDDDDDDDDDLYEDD